MKPAPLARRIVIEGPIGVGKTSLALRLAARMNAPLRLEAPADNPFLARFYAAPARYALAAQLSFLAQRARQQRLWQEAGEASWVGDFLLEKDALFARLTLAPDELILYGQLHAELALQPAAPDLVIHLRATPATLLARIAARGIAAEAAIDAGYLARLSAAYDELFAHYSAAPVLTVETAHFNPVDREADLDHLIARMNTMRSAHEHFDLAA